MQYEPLESLASPELRADIPGKHAFLIQPSSFADRLTCLTAQTYYGYDQESDRWLIVGKACNRWTCAYCARVKCRRLAWLTERAKPNRLLTLTVNPQKHADPRAAFDATRCRVPELFRRLRNQFGEVEYLRVTETTKAGYPHYHCLLRSKYLPHPVVKKHWEDLTAASIVDVRQVSNSFKAYWYLVKYLTKMSNLQWTERHVSYSKQFFRPEDLEKIARPPLEQPNSSPLHPHQFLAQKYPGDTALYHGPLRYSVAGRPGLNHEEIDPKELGLPRPADSPWRPKTQQNLGYTDAVRGPALLATASTASIDQEDS